jgi:hypothetical protein
MSIYITDDNGSLIINGSTKAVIKSSIQIVGSGTELPITIEGDFKDIPPHLHETYMQSMLASYGSVNVYDNTKDDEPYSLSIPPEILYKKPSRLKTLIFDLYKKIIWKKTNEM